MFEVGTYLFSVNKVQEKKALMWLLPFV